MMERWIDVIKNDIALLALLHYAAESAKIGG